MSSVTILVCEGCGVEERSDQREPVYWSCRMAECSWSVPPDGANFGQFKGHLCAGCRKAVHDAIGAVLAKRKGAPDDH